MTINHLPFEKTEIEGSIMTRWQRVVEHFPEHIAVTTVNGERYTYAELDQAANRLAHALLNALGAENCPVVLLFDHAYPLLIGILGTLKAGKAYVAFDTTQELEQLQLLYQIVAPPVLVTNTTYYALAQAIANMPEPTTLNPQRIWLLETLPEITAVAPAPSIAPDAIATIVFTSGTVKQPKGVARSHRIVLYRTWYAVGTQPFGPGHCIAGIRHCGLGGGMLYLFYALLYGATYCLYDLKRGGLQDLAEWLQRERISYFPPQIVLFRQWLETLGPEAFYPHLRYIEPSGRKTSADLEPLWPHVSDECSVHTGYAATEIDQITSALITRHTSLPEGVLHVGTPLPDRTVSILQEDGQTVAVGEIGEIVVRSRYIPTGYWQQPELSSERFIQAGDGSGETSYRTGDFGYWRSDGYLELVGRQDSQVKLRGYRVVLGEVEDALRTLPSVKEAVVTADEEKGLLLAYLVAASEPPPPASLLRDALATRLPHYALPNHIIFLPHFPLLTSGKVNRRALPAPELSRGGLTTPYVPPRTQVEAELVAIWERLLPVHPIGVEDHFFDLGGHSILALRLLHAVEQQFQQPVALRQFIFKPTIAYLATLFNTNGNSEAPDGEKHGVLSTLLDNAELRALYDALDNKAEIDRLRAPMRSKPQLPRSLQRLLRLPQPVALPLFYELLQQTWVQQRSMSRQTALVQQFLAELEDKPAQKSLVARCLFFGALSHFEVRQTLFTRLQAANKISIEGLDALTAARSRQQGVILLTSHNYQSPYFRTFRLTQGWISNMTLLTSNRQFDKVRAEQILYARQLELASQTLQRGQAIYIAPDVDRGHGTSITVPFHGRMHPFRTSFADLALLTDAQIFFVASDLQAYNRFSFQLVGPFDMGNAAMRHEERVQHLMDQYVAHLRQQWAQNPWALPWWLMGEHLAYPSVTLEKCEVNTI
ncbi:MAG: AMP-binding protein [Caldilineaceae bacterium]